MMGPHAAVKIVTSEKSLISNHSCENHKSRISSTEDRIDSNHVTEKSATFLPCSTGFNRFNRYGNTDYPDILRVFPQFLQVNANMEVLT